MSLTSFTDSSSAQQTQQPLPLSSPAVKDLELPINILGERAAFQVSTNQAGDTTRGLLAWNDGGNPSYAAQVLARRPHYL